MKIAVCVKQVPEGGDASGSTRDASGSTAPARPRSTRSTLNAIEEALRVQGGVRRGRGRARLDGPASARSTSLRKGSGDGRRPRRARLRRRGARAPISSPRALCSRRRSSGKSADLVLFGQQASDSDGAVLWAAVAERLRLPLVSQVVGARRSTDGAVDREAADRVRIRPDRRAAAGRRRRLGRDQRAALPVAEGDHGREVEAAGDALRRRPGPRRRRRRRGGLAHGGARARRPAAARRHAEDRGRRLSARRRSSTCSWRGSWCEDARLPRAPRRRDPEGLARRARQGRVARRRRRGVLVGAGRRATQPPRPARTARRRCTSPTSPELAAPLAQPRVDVLAQGRARGRATTRCSSASRCSPPTSPRRWPSGSTQA